ncbi:MAG: hypothetical protein HUJ76_11195 [Parasporobacterium sp.]|nr:hypothetical protein [Parasporobacterium sp.]
MIGLIGLLLAVVGLAGGIIFPLLIPGIGFAAWIFVVLSLAGLIVSVIARKKSTKKGAGTAGIVIAIVGIVVSVIMAIACSSAKVAVDYVEKQNAELIEEVESALENVDTSKLEEGVKDVMDQLEAQTEAATE